VIIRPSPLRPGDRVAVVAPASACAPEELDRGEAELRRLGFEPVHSAAVLERSTFTAGSAETRAADFMRAWADPSVAALVALRGGYGSAELLPLLLHLRPALAPKLFIGYSDNTALLSWLTCACNVAALHGPMVDARLAKGAEGYDERSFLSAVRGEAGELAPPGLTTLRSGEATGFLFGGTMTMLTASLGTPYAFMPPGECILFLEDVNERPYRLVRMLTQLRQAGVLVRARALVFGEMRGCDEPGGTVTAIDAIREAMHDFHGPILCGFPSGHTTGPLWTLPLGALVRVVGAPSPAVVVEEPAVEPARG
jgi:muramoyltetrapeptide carboxypeptidase